MCISRSGHLRGSRATRRYRSSSEAERGFCDRCGSTLAMHEAVLDDRVQVALGSLDRPEDVRPDDHVWTESQLPWLRSMTTCRAFRAPAQPCPRVLWRSDGSRPQSNGG